METMLTISFVPRCFLFTEYNTILFPSSKHTPSFPPPHGKVLVNLWQWLISQKNLKLLPIIAWNKMNLGMCPYRRRRRKGRTRWRDAYYNFSCQWYCHKAEKYIYIHNQRKRCVSNLVLRVLFFSLPIPHWLQCCEENVHFIKYVNGGEWNGINNKRSDI